MRPAHWTFAIATMALLLSDFVAWGLGLGFDATSLDWFWQFLDPSLLRTDLLRSVWYHHGQPPLFDLFLGAVLELPAPVVPAAFAIIYQAMALGVLWGVAWLLQRLATPTWLVVAATLGLALEPAFVIDVRWLFHPLPIAFVLVVSAVAIVRFVDTGRPAWAHVAGGATAVLMLMRAVFHPAWLVVATAAMCLRLDPTRRRTLVGAMVLPLVLVNLWCTKNWMQVGVYGMTSWLGMHLRRGLELSPEELRPLVASGTIPPVWAARPFLPASSYKRFGYFAAPPPADGHPAIDAPLKSNGERNLNHREYVRISRDMLAGVGPVLRAYPRRYLERTGRALWLFLQPGPLVLFAHTDVSRLMAFRDGMNRLLFGAAPVGLRGVGGGSWNLLMVAFAAAFVAGVWLATHGSRGDVGEAVVATYLTITLLWFTAIVNLVEVGENDRMRGEVDPVVLVLFMAGVGAVVRWLAILRQRRRLAR